MGWYKVQGIDNDTVKMMKAAKKKTPSKSDTTTRRLGSDATTQTLGRGNCLKLLYQLSPQSIDLVLCDLPFGVTQNRWDKVIPLAPLWKAYEYVCKPDANIVLFAVRPFTSKLTGSRLDWWKDDLVWVKNKTTGYLNAKFRPLRQHEQLLVFRGQGRGVYNPQKTQGHPPMHKVAKHGPTKAKTYGAQRGSSGCGGSTERYPTSVLHFPKVNNDDPERRHEHQKPLPLLEYLIRTYSNPGNTVLDNTMGSGATGIACINTGRHFVGIEFSSHFFDLAEEWILSTASRESDNKGLQSTT
jgi:site-specific DNA-methyltransferase (adenine-specific)